MAIDNPVDPLDSLGPDFGGINRPTPGDIKDVTPFEGDIPLLPEPNIIQHPFGPHVHKDQQVVRNTSIGREPIYKVNPKDELKGILKNVAAKSQVYTDRNAYAQPFSYDAGANSNAFYDRYAAYGDETFSKVGFSAFRDNEAVFNSRTTMWDDWGRMLQHSFMPLLSRGFVSGPKSLVRALQGDFGSDPEDAEVYERASAIGQSSKEGLSAFFNNTAMNFGYTAGIILEAVAEEVAGAILAPVTGGTSFVAATANNLRKIKGIGTAQDLINSVNKTIRGASTVSGARKLWQASKLDNVIKAGGTALDTKLGKFLNPLENVRDTYNVLKRNEDNLTGLARAMSGTFQTAGALYRDVRNINMALAEARLEGGFVENTVYDRLYNEYYHEKGFSPNDEIQQNMMAQAKEAGMEALTWNTGLIYVSNKILLPNIMGPKGGIRKYIANKTKEILETPVSGGRIIGKTTKLKSGKVIKSPEFAFEKSSLKNNLKSLGRAPLGKTLTGLGSYFRVNISEGIQENLQEMIAYANEKYYVDSFQDPRLANHLYSRAAYLEGLKEQFTAQGFETFASGFFMGMFAGPLNQALPALSTGYSKYFDSENYKANLAARASRQEGLARVLTDLTSNPETFFNPRFQNYASQSRTSDVKANAESTIKENIDYSEQAFFDNMLTALETDTLGNVKDYFSSLQELTVQEFEEALGIEKGQGAERQAKIGQVLQKMDSIEESYKKYDKMFPSPLNTKDLEEGTDKYRNAQLYNNAWRISKRNLIFANQAFVDTSLRMSDIEQDIISAFSDQGISQMDVQVLFESQRLANERAILEDEIAGMESVKGEKFDDTLLKQKQDKLVKLKSFEDAFNSFRDHFFNKEKQKELFMSMAKEEEMTPDQLAEIELTILDAQAETDVERIAELKDAFKDYIVTVSKNQNQNNIIFDEQLSETFDKLVDYLKLSDERAAMAELVNVLHAPADYYDLVEKNLKWSRKLYENRKDYFKDMVNLAMTNAENNSLINALADRDIYISQDDLDAFIEDGEIPKEFYRERNKQVIREGHPDYPGLLALFDEIYKARKGEIKPEVTNEELRKELDELEKKKQSELDALEKIPTREDIGEIKPPTGKKLTARVIHDNMDVGDYVEVSFKRKGQDEAEISTYYKSEKGLHLDNENGELINLKNKQRFDSAMRFAIVEKADPKLVQEIEDKYKKLEAELYAKYNAQDQQQGQQPAQYTPITYDTPLEKMPNELRALIEAEYDEYLNANPLEKEEYFKLTAEQQEDAIARFAFESPLAHAVIDEYNRTQRIKMAKASAEDIVIPKIYVGGELIDVEEASVQDLRKYERMIAQNVKNLRDNQKRTDEEEAEYQKGRLLLKQLNDYIAYRSALTTFPGLEEMKARLSVLKKMQDRISFISGSHTYLVDNKIIPNSVTQVTSSLFDPFNYPGTELVEGAYNLTLGDPNQSATAEDFVNKFEELNKNNNGFAVSDHYNLLRSGRFAISRNDSLEEVLRKISDVAYEESRIAGNYFDEQAKLLFSNKTPVFDETKVTKEAFDNVFGEKGYLTKIKKRVDSGEMYILAENLRVFDSELGIAGEIDLLVLDNNGNVYIIDVKTGKASPKWNNFLNGTDKDGSPSYGKITRDKYFAQARAYANLLYNMTGIKTARVGVLPIEIDFEKDSSKVISAGAPTNKNLVDPDLQLFYIYPPGYARDIAKGVDELIPRKSPEEADKAAGINVGATLSPDARKKLRRLGFTDSMINIMTKEDSDTALTFTSKEDAKELIKKYSLLVQEPDVNVIGGGTPVITDEERQLREEALRIKKAEQDAYKKNSQIIRNKIDILKKRRDKAGADAQTIRDTLGFLDDLYNSAVEGTLNDIEGMIAKIDNLDRVSRHLIKANQIKRGQKVALSKDILINQVKREFSAADDVLSRIRELKADLEQLEALQKDLNSQMSFYKNLLKDKTLKALDFNDIDKKINQIQKKLSKVEKMINLIRKAIRQSVAYLNEYVKIWNKHYKALDQFKEQTGFEYLSQEEVQKLIKSTDPADIEKIDNYASLKTQFEQLEANALNTIDDIELLEEVKDKENERLGNLTKQAVKYQNQLRYLEELIFPVFDEIGSEVLVDVNVESPDPVNTAGEDAGSGIDSRINDLESQQERNNQVIASLSLGTIGESFVREAPGSAFYPDMLAEINSIETMDDYKKAVINLISRLETTMISMQQYNELNEILNQVYNEKFSEDPTVFTVTEETIKNKDRFVVIKPIYLLSQGDVVIVTEMDGVNYTIKKADEEGYSVLIPKENFTDSLVLESKIENMEDVKTEDLNNESKNNFKSSTDVGQDLMDDQARLAALRKDIDKKSDTELEDYANELRNNLKDNLNC
jgi:hypothetical protein